VFGIKKLPKKKKVQCLISSATNTFLFSHTDRKYVSSSKLRSSP